LTSTRHGVLTIDTKRTMNTKKPEEFRNLKTFVFFVAFVPLVTRRR
jgi:hypothetical protein